MTENRADNRFDVLRLVAAWLVLFSHCYPLGGRPLQEPLASTVGLDTLGGVGVAIFFVLSGYLVTLSLERSPNLLVFARRRALRIYPALVVTGLLSVFLLGPWLSSLPFKTYGTHATTWSYLKTITAFRIQYPLPGVFEHNPLPHAVNGSLWSLPYELKCYLALVALGLMPGPMRIKSLLALVLLLIYVVARPAVPPANPLQAFWGLDYYHGKLGLLFATGAVFASWRASLQPRGWPALLLLGLALAVPPGSMQLVLFLLGLGQGVLWLALKGRWLPVIPPRMGDWSYGAYLYGFPVQQTLAHLGLHNDSFVAFVLASTLLTLVLAGLSWHCIEKPVLRWK